MDEPSISGRDVVPPKGKRQRDTDDCMAMPDNKGEEKKAKIDEPGRAGFVASLKIRVPEYYDSDCEPTSEYYEGDCEST
ncbi:hypothetical protein BAE44_0012126 [Dichanthelium oligosanthes]|uniref:Uncharacterized protein n=1 Tax=Dichanthelium oligosanthes TaxID=888268 RepID=A0A1E5VP52_9POAL|nr:hypothetical protein BAE44_0012126 [Dichanthelium oligosanthes]